MRKIIYITVLIMIFMGTKNGYAQLNLGIDAGVRIPSTITYNNTLYTGYGVAATGEYVTSYTPLSITLCAGFDNWGYKSSAFYVVSNSGVRYTNLGNVNMYSYILAAGPKLFIQIPETSLSVYAGISAGFMSATSSLQDASYGTGFIYSPSVGFRYKLSSRKTSLDLNVTQSNFKQSGTPTFSWIEVNAGLYFSL